jgi:hypothetical protein
MDFSDVEITTELVIAVIGGLGLLVEVLVLLGPVIGDPRRKRKRDGRV